MAERGSILARAVRACTLRRHECELLLRITGVLLALPVLQRVLALPALLHLLDARAPSPACVTPSRLLVLVRGVYQLPSRAFRKFV